MMRYTTYIGLLMAALLLTATQLAAVEYYVAPLIRQLAVVLTLGLG